MAESTETAGPESYLRTAPPPALRPELTVSQLLQEAVQRRPDAPALAYSAYDDIGLQLRWSYAELEEQALAAAGALIASGLQPGDRIAVWATNVPQHPLLQFACACANVVLVPLNPLYRAEELSYALLRSEARACFAVPEDRGTDLWSILTGAAESVPSLDLLVALDQCPDSQGVSWDDWLATGDGQRDKARQRQTEVRPEDLSQIQFTSGTTGFPKGVRLPNWVLANQGIQMAARAGFDEGVRYVNPMPLFHCGGCVVGALGVLAAGGLHLPTLKFDPARVVQTIDMEQATALAGVPTMLLAVEEHVAETGTDLSCLTRIVSGGSPVPSDLAQRLRERYGVEFVITYGQTEHGPLVSVAGPEDPPELQVSTCGRPLPNVEVEVVEPGGSKRVPLGVEGELRFRGFVMDGYQDDPDATAATVDDDGWLRSGDLGTLDDSGYVRVTGRAKDLIIRGGENIAPTAVEDALLRLDAIADASVIGVPDDRYGEAVCAYVRLREGAQLTHEETVNALTGTIARFKIPRHLRFIDEFPTTPSGKIQKFKLREMFEAETSAAV